MLTELIDRLKAAPGPNQDIDGDVWWLIDRQSAERCYWTAGLGMPRTLGETMPAGLGRSAVRMNAPDYTHSIDAALTAMPPGARLRELGQWDDNGSPGGWFAIISRYIKTGEHSWEIREFSYGIPDPMDFAPKVPTLAPNGAIAVLIPILKARAS